MRLILTPAKLIKRYKRFLADINLEDNAITTIHVANTGAMTGCAEPNNTIWYSTSNNAKRKYPFSWELTHTQSGNTICVNTIRANQLVEEALLNKSISALTQYQEIQREVKYGEENSKIDFLLTSPELPPCYVEVKSVTLLDEEIEGLNSQGYFPDAVSKRGQKHLRELIEIAAQGHKAVLLFAVLHSGINSVKAATHIDPDYAKLLIQAQQQGVEVLAYKAKFSWKSASCDINLTELIPVAFSHEQCSE